MTLLLACGVAFCSLAGAASPASSAARISQESVDWLRLYPLAPYRETWNMTVDVKDLGKDLSKVMQAVEKNGGKLLVPLQNSAASPSTATQQLAYRLTRAQAAAALKALHKVGQSAPPIVQPSGELLPVREIEAKIAALSADKTRHGRELSSMPAVASLVDAVLGHLVTAKAIAEKTDIEVTLDLTVRGASPK